MWFAITYMGQFYPQVMNSITHGVCTYCHLKSSLHHSNFLIAGAVYPVWHVEKTRPQDVVYKQFYNLFIAGRACGQVVSWSFLSESPNHKVLGWWWHPSLLATVSR